MFTKRWFDAIKLTKEMLNDEVPLIGFAGSPWTIMCYAVEGQGSKSFDEAKDFVSPKQHVLLQKPDTTILYLKEKVKAGVNAVQILILGAECYLQLTIKILLEIHQPNRGTG
jgi:uroporphyrinogen decarboxylase